jgi:hypothetical protein
VTYEIVVAIIGPAPAAATKTAKYLAPGELSGMASSKMYPMAQTDPQKMRNGARRLYLSDKTAVPMVVKKQST